MPAKNKSWGGGLVFTNFQSLYSVMSVFVLLRIDESCVRSYLSFPQVAGGGRGWVVRGLRRRSAAAMGTGMVLQGDASAALVIVVGLRDHACEKINIV